MEFRNLGPIVFNNYNKIWNWNVTNNGHTGTKLINLRTNSTDKYLNFLFKWLDKRILMLRNQKHLQLGEAIIMKLSIFYNFIFTGVKILNQVFT